MEFQTPAVSFWNAGYAASPIAAAAWQAKYARKRSLLKMINMGIMEKKMETTIVYWGYIGITEKKMETTIAKSEPTSLFSYSLPIWMTLVFGALPS